MDFDFDFDYEEEVALEQAQDSEALLLGRVTYEDIGPGLAALSS